MAARVRARRIRTASIVTKQGQTEARVAARRAARLLERRGVQVTFDPETAEALGRSGEGRAPGGRGRPADLYVVLGGDGTLLRVARAIASTPRPILGVNLGGLGFLTETRVDEMDGTLNAILAGRGTLERRMALEVSLARAGRTIMKQTILNDVVINKSALARIIDLGVTIDGQLVTTYKSDGLIVSTPTGSTAYSLSAGGPIIHPKMEALLIAPICPHTLSMRPLVVPPDSRVEITLATGDSEVYLTLDGQVGHPLRTKDKVQVRRSDRPILMVRTGPTSYFEVLRHKMHWGKR
jgi:NAD+ kinase